MTKKLTRAFQKLFIDKINVLTIGVFKQIVKSVEDDRVRSF